MHAGVSLLPVVVDIMVNLSAKPRVFENCTLNVEDSRKSSSIVSYHHCGWFVIQ